MAPAKKVDVATLSGCMLLSYPMPCASPIDADLHSLHIFELAHHMLLEGGAIV